MHAYVLVPIHSQPLSVQWIPGRSPPTNRGTGGLPGRMLSEAPTRDNQPARIPLPAGAGAMRSHSSSLGLALVSAAALVFEIGLSRLFAIQQFHHFAFVVVSLAMMGSAASGILLAARPRAPSVPALAGGLAASVLVAYLILNFLPFDSYSLAWDGRQVLLLGIYFLAAGTPFLFAGWVGGACLASAGPQAHRPYAASLIGASFGSLAAMLALAWIPPEGLVFLAAALALAGAAALATRRVVRLIHLLAALIAIALALRLPSFLTLRLSPYKPLVVAGLAPDARRTLTLYSAASRLDVLENPLVPPPPPSPLQPRGGARPGAGPPPNAHPLQRRLPARRPRRRRRARVSRPKPQRRSRPPRASRSFP